MHFYTDGEVKCSLEDVLIFFSGSANIPPLGFPMKPSLRFLCGEEARLATASTCDLVLRIPTCYGKEYPSFKEWMEVSIMSVEFFEQ